MNETMATGTTRRLINVREYYKMAEEGILEPDEKLELISGEVLQRNTSGKKRLLSIEEYHKMGEAGILQPSEKTELIHGEIFKRMSPVGSRHVDIVNILTRLLVSRIEHFVVSVQNPIVLGPSIEVEPDFSILRQKQDYRDVLPEAADALALIEVSDSTIEYDHKTKMGLYAAARIPTYCIVNIPDNQIEVFSNPQDETYLEMQTFIKGDSFELGGAKFTVSEILQ